MISLYVTSPKGYSGKSLFCFTFGAYLKSKGIRVGYFKPVGNVLTKVGSKVVEEDAAFISRRLDLEEPLDLLSPVLLTSDLIKQALEGKAGDLQKDIKEAFNKIGQNKDIMIIGGAGTFVSTGSLLSLSANRIVNLLGAKVLVVVNYDSDLAIEDLLPAKEIFKDSLTGAVLNNVRKDDINRVKNVVMPWLEDKGVPIFGVIPRDTILSSVSVRELVDRLAGKVLCCPDKLDELVEQFGVGAMSVESALKYLRKMVNKAVITGGDRADIQLAALETPTKCIILTGNLYPNSVVLTKAEEVGVPMIVVPYDTLTTVQRIEEVLGRPRVEEPKKIQRAEELFSTHVDFDRIYKSLKGELLT